MLTTMALAITNTGREKMADSQWNLRNSFESQWCLEQPVLKAHGLGVQNEAEQRLIEFCEENALVIANTLFQQQKRRLYTWTSPDGQHRNQIDYILCSQRRRRSIQSAKTRPGADCGSDHELLIAKFRLKLKDDLGEWHWNMYNIIYEMNRQSRLDAWHWMLGAGALRRPRGMVWERKRVGGSGWEHVYTYSGFMLAKPIQYCKVINLQLR